MPSRTATQFDERRYASSHRRGAPIPGQQQAVPANEGRASGNDQMKLAPLIIALAAAAGAIALAVAAPGHAATPARIAPAR